MSMAFRPRPEQEILFDHLLTNPTVPAYVIKSRRLGISTAVDTFMTDQAVNRKGFRGLIIDQTQADATKKMVEIVRFAADSLPPEILTRIKFDKRNDSEMRLRVGSEPESKDSVVYATTGGRGGDCSMLHVSEWGPIAATDPVRSREIRTGTFPSARLGRRVVETTWYGGKGGDLWDMVDPILKADPNAEGIIYFFPWHSDPAAIRTAGMVTEEIKHYFDELTAKLGKTFSQEQKLWYAAKKIEQGIFVKREYPSTLEEAFSAPVQGSIYGEVIDELRATQRIRQFAWDRSCPVFAAWDLGWGDCTSIWVFQIVGLDIHWIWHTRQTQHTAADMVRILSDTELSIQTHFLPHDVDKTAAADGKTYKDALRAAGLLNIVSLPRTTNIWVGINSLRSLLKRSWFRSPECDEGLTALAAYHTKEIASGSAVSAEPVHDWASHDSDAARYVAEAMELGLVSTHAAKRLINAPPRYPDGSMVSLEVAQDHRRSRRPVMALGGHSAL